VSRRPWLSVVLPVYNGARFLPAALDSIRAQQTADLEVIAVDDGSSDGTREILRHYQSRLPLSIVARPHRGNWVAGTNHGIGLARGRWISILHQDDGWFPGRLQALRRIAEATPAAGLILQPAEFVDAAGRRLIGWRCPLRGQRRPLPAGLLLERLLVQNFVAMPAPLVRREAVLRSGLLDETLWYTADWDLWLKLAAAERAVYDPRPGSWFRLHAQSQTACGGQGLDDFRRQLEVVLARHLPIAVRLDPGISARSAAAARFSIEMNVALKAAALGQRPDWRLLAGQAFALGPSALGRYLRHSRIVERVGARLLARGLF